MYVCIHECMCVYNIYGIKRIHVSVGIHTCVHYTYMCTYDYVVYNNIMRTYVYAHFKYDTMCLQCLCEYDQVSHHQHLCKDYSLFCKVCVLYENSLLLDIQRYHSLSTNVCV